MIPVNKAFIGIESTFLAFINNKHRADTIAKMDNYNPNIILYPVEIKHYDIDSVVQSKIPIFHNYKTVNNFKLKDTNLTIHFLSYINDQNDKPWKIVILMTENINNKEYDVCYMIFDHIELEYPKIVDEYNSDVIIVDKHYDESYVDIFLSYLIQNNIIQLIK